MKSRKKRNRSGNHTCVSFASARFPGGKTQRTERRKKHKADGKCVCITAKEGRTTKPVSTASKKVHCTVHQSCHYSRVQRTWCGTVRNDPAGARCSFPRMFSAAFLRFFFLSRAEIRKHKRRVGSRPPFCALQNKTENNTQKQVFFSSLSLARRKSETRIAFAVRKVHSQKGSELLRVSKKATQVDDSNLLFRRFDIWVQFFHCAVELHICKSVNQTRCTQCSQCRLGRKQRKKTKVRYERVRGAREEVLHKKYINVYRFRLSLSDSGRLMYRLVGAVGNVCVCVRTPEVGKKMTASCARSF